MKHADTRWRIWITGYPGSYVELTADDHREAMVRAARELKASHRGEIVEINARSYAGISYSKFVRIPRGRLEFQ